jgi:hypothetical protein
MIDCDIQPHRRYALDPKPGSSININGVVCKIVIVDNWMVSLLTPRLQAFTITYCDWNRNFAKYEVTQP